MVQKNNGKLIVAGLDIGNKLDIPKRTLDAVATADFIVAEHAELMEMHFTRLEIPFSVKMYNYLPDLPDREERINFILNKIKDGNTTVLISSEGMPLIHDPGYEIVKRVRDENLPITVIPGPSAVIAALAISGADSWRFSFESDVPTDFATRNHVFYKICKEDKTVIFFEKDWQLLSSLQHLGNVGGYSRKIAICINLTFPDELVFRGTVAEAIEYFSINPRISPQEEQNKIVLIITQELNENIN
jgi:16S rRNA (cytidine1402-2'-O)-methyltransferase